MTAKQIVRDYIFGRDLMDWDRGRGPKFDGDPFTVRVPAILKDKTVSAIERAVQKKREAFDEYWLESKVWNGETLLWWSGIK